MIDVFVRIHHTEMCCDKTGIRAGMSQAVLARWLLQKDCRLEEIFGEGADFHIASKKAAELNATSSIYVIADADCLILGKDFISKGVATLESHPEYGLLSATSICDGLFPAGHELPIMPDVIEMHAVGGIAFVRRGILTEFRDCRPDQVDGTICDEINRKGLKTGVMTHVRFNHLGAGYSLTSKGCWGA
jgi:hypothetical protein